MLRKKTYRLKAETEVEAKAETETKTRRTAKVVRESAVLPDGTCEEVAL